MARHYIQNERIQMGVTILVFLACATYVAQTYENPNGVHHAGGGRGGRGDGDAIRGYAFGVGLAEFLTALDHVSRRDVRGRRR